ncbi:hypothetical protein [uncultured Hymenobacter sp.]|uniref:hypothetical protein n=1 Tax=uncultured Hymenobacter sp. TaxID=170016 RepID=UPI0035CB286E
MNTELRTPILAHYLFIDECGDPNFYGAKKKLLQGQKGYQPLLLMGLLSTSNRRMLREQVLAFQQEILQDELYNSIPSVAKPNWYLHAKDDHPEVRAKFFERLRKLPDFSIHIVIGRKKLDIFTRKHNSNPTEFYFDLLHHLLKDCMHEEQREHSIYLAQRAKNNLSRFQEAVEKALAKDNAHRPTPKKIVYKSSIVLSSQYPELSIVDYCLWALQRYIYKDESRFFKALQTKYARIVDLYDEAHYAGRGNFYNPANPFDTQLASPFEKPIL